MDAQLDHAPCGFLSFADDRTILQVNATLAGWLGYERTELVGQPIESILSVGGRIFCQTHIFPLLKLKGRVEEIYFSLQTRDRKSLEVITSACRREEAGATANDCIFLPMRQRRRYEDELLGARKAADDASEAKARFLSMMSHELRTPMNAILGFGQLMEMGDLKPGQAEMLSHILHAGEHLLRLINEVLDLSRIEAGRMDLSPEAASAAEIMRDVFQMSLPLAIPYGAKLHLAPGAGDACEVYADVGRLRQILLNFVANAIKYNRPGGSVFLECQSEPGTTGTEKVRFAVRDTGFGIAPEQLGKLFTPFERLGAESSRIEGTGLGLALCKRLAEAMGGQIEVESRVGEGSQFSLELPLATCSRVAAFPTDAATESSGALETSRGIDSLLLYVEDNPSNTALVQGVLAFRPAMRLLTAANGEAGLALARAETLDLILLDLHLPDLAGDIVLERLRADPRTRNVPVVILSADAAPSSIAHLLDAGAYGYLTKPLDVKKLLSVIDAALGPAKTALLVD